MNTITIVGPDGRLLVSTETGAILMRITSNDTYNRVLYFDTDTLKAEKDNTQNIDSTGYYYCPENMQPVQYLYQKPKVPRAVKKFDAYEIALVGEIKTKAGHIVCDRLYEIYSGTTSKELIVAFKEDEEYANDEISFYWSLYGHINGEGTQCIGDFTSAKHAIETLEHILGRSLDEYAEAAEVFALIRVSSDD